jgi:hypothetical protein
MITPMRTPGALTRELGLMPVHSLEFPICSLSSYAPTIRTADITFLGGKEDGEVVPEGKLKVGQTAILAFGTVMPRGDILVGVHPGLLRAGVVGNPVILPGSRTTREHFYIIVEAKRAINLLELPWHVSVAGLAG